MKKILAVVLSLVIVMAAFAGCTSKPSTGTSTKGPIAIIIPSGDHGWTAAVSYYATQKCKALGLASGSGYKILTSANVNDQANQIDEMISQKASAIVLLPLNDDVSVAAQKIMDAKIPLVDFDRTITGAYTAHVAGDNKAMGTLSADFIGSKLNGAGIVAVFNTPSVGSVNTDRVGGFKDEMAAKYPNIKLIDVTEDGYTSDAGLKTATDMLTANAHIDAVFSTDDEPSTGILQAINDAKRTDVKYISGGGGEQAFLNKISTVTNITLFTATYSPSMVQSAIQEASDLVAGKTVAKETIIPPTIVTSANASKFLDATSPY